jgi:hypothetical protein
MDISFLIILYNIPSGRAIAVNTAANPPGPEHQRTEADHAEAEMAFRPGLSISGKARLRRGQPAPAELVVWRAWLSLSRLAPILRAIYF